MDLGRFRWISQGLGAFSWIQLLLVRFSWFQQDLAKELYKKIPYGKYGKYGMVSIMASKGNLSRSWMTDRAPYNIVCLDYLVYLVYITTGSIGGNGSIRLPVVSVVMVVSGCCSISQNRDLCVFLVFGVAGMNLTRRQRRGRRILYYPSKAP